MSKLPAVTDETFGAEVERHEGVVMVDFWAVWCGPCRMIAPIVEQLATEYAGRAKIVGLDGDANPRTLARYGVRGLPTLLVFRDGQLVDRIVGAAPRAKIEGTLQQHLTSSAA